MFLLLLSLVSFLHHFTNATDPLYETVFVAGPEPQPVVFDTKDSPLGNLFGGDDSANMIDVALPSIPLENMEGRRKLKVPAQLVPPNVRSGSQSVGRDQHWKPDDTERYHDGVNNADEKHSAGLPRSLQGVCSIATTIFGFKYDDNGVENNGFFSIPPDPHGAVGATRLVAVVNAMMEVRQKDGTLMFRDGFQSFFSGFSEAFATGARFFDPKVIYDEHQRRFVIVVLQRSDSPQLSRIWLSVSKGESPDSVADWNQFFINSIFVIDGNNAWADYPGLEVDEEAVYVTNNMFRFSDRANVGVRLWTFSKGVTNGFYAGQVFSPLVINPYATQGIALTSMPAQVHGSSGVDGWNFSSRHCFLH